MSACTQFTEFYNIIPHMAAFNFLRFSPPSVQGSWDRAVGVVITLRAEPTIRGSIPGRGDFSFLRRIHTDYVAHPASYSILARKAEAVGVWTWPLTSDHFWGYEWVELTSVPTYVLMACTGTIQPSSSTISTWHRALTANLQHFFF